MPQIIPNWHPLLVHFPIALFFAATLLFAATYLLPQHRWASDWHSAARWTLRLAALGAIAAALAGAFAFASVDHDEAGHAAMLLHRRWALPSATAILLLALWEGCGWIRGKTGSTLFLLCLLVTATAVAITAGLGGELVYRHRVGVQAPPAPAVPSPVAAPQAATQHEHNHAHGHEH